MIKEVKSDDNINTNSRAVSGNVSVSVNPWALSNWPSLHNFFRRHPTLLTKEFTRKAQGYEYQQNNSSPHTAMATSSRGRSV